MSSCDTCRARLPENLRDRRPPLRPAPCTSPPASVATGWSTRLSTVPRSIPRTSSTTTGPSSPAAGRCDPVRSTASPPRRNGRTSWPTSSHRRSRSASVHATSAPPGSVNTPASAVPSCDPIPSRCPDWRRSTRTCSTGSRRPRNRAGLVRSPLSKPACRAKAHRDARPRGQAHHRPPRPPRHARLPQCRTS